MKKVITIAIVILLSFATFLTSVACGGEQNSNLKPKSYSITYVLDGGTNDERNPTTYTYIESKELFPATKEGFEFLGWVEQEGGAYLTEIQEKSSGDKVLYAQWKQLEPGTVYYKVDFVLNNGDISLTINNKNSVATKYLEEGESLVWQDGFEIKVSNEGYVLEGWYYNDGTNEVKADIEKPFNSTNYPTVTDYTITFYPKFSAKAVAPQTMEICYVLECYVDGLNGVKTTGTITDKYYRKTIAVGEKFNNLPNVTLGNKEYQFTGWVINFNGKNYTVDTNTVWNEEFLPFDKNVKEITLRISASDDINWIGPF